MRNAMSEDIATSYLNDDSQNVWVSPATSRCGGLRRCSVAGCSVVSLTDPRLGYLFRRAVSRRRCESCLNLPLCITQRALGVRPNPVPS